MKHGRSSNTLLEEIMAIGGLRIQIWEDDFQHAVKGHPEVTIEKIRSALKLPVKVIQSKKSNRACLFYSTDEGEELYFCVVVSVLRDGVGKLETAYQTTFIKTGKSLYTLGGCDDG